MIKVITIWTSVIVVLSGSVAYAGTPIFIDKIKSKFSRSSQSTAQPVSANARSNNGTTATSTAVVQNSKSAVGTSRADILANRRAALSMATTKSAQNDQQMEAYRLAAIQNASGNPSLATATTSGTTSAPSKQPERVIIKKKASATESNAPKPIFRNFR